MPQDRNNSPATPDDNKSAILIAYIACAACGFLWGIAAGWAIWG